MIVKQTKNPSMDPSKREKINLFEKTTPSTKIQDKQKDIDSKKVSVRVDSRTVVLVDPSKKKTKEQLIAKYSKAAVIINGKNVL